MKAKLCFSKCHFLTCRAFGIAVFSFCIGMLLGFFFPVEFVAVLETLLLLFLAYLCIFQW